MKDVINKPGTFTMEATLTKLEKPLLRVGSQGFEVIELNLLLQSYGLPISIDGEISDFFGQFTKNAVINFQEAMFLTVDGIVGNNTWLALYQGSPINKPNLQLGSRGESVAQLQTRLQQLRYNVGAIDSIFGSRTQEAVIEFQQEFQLNPDGKVDEASWNKLAELKLKMFTQIPQVEVFSRGRKLRIYGGGKLDIVDITRINILILDSFDCSQFKQVDEQELYGKFIVGEPVVNPETKDIAVAVVLSECVEIQQSAVFIIGGKGGYYRLQVPGKRSLPHEFSSYALSSIYKLDYSHGNLLVTHGDASGGTAMLVFKPGKNPAGQFAGCVELDQGENPILCPQYRR